MADAGTTAGERLERLQGLLTGARSDSRVGRNLARVPKANVLFGAVLHAADRLRQGEELTDLEEVLLGGLRGALGDEEVKEWGRVYRESVTARGSLTGVPAVITGRSVSQGYGFEDLEEDLPAVTAEWTAQSNWSAVDHKALAAGADFDSAEFVESMREWGWAVTLPAHLVASGDDGAVQEGREEIDAAAYRFRLSFENFHVHRTVGDGWPGVGDEIRWVSAGQSDLGAPAVPFLSQEFGSGSADAGRTPAFHVGRHIVFDAGAENGLVLNVTCWEWDTGDGNDDSIGERLILLNRDPLFSLIWGAVAELAPSLIGLLMDLTSLGITVVSLIARNDVSASRSLYLDRHALAALSQSGSAQWHFNGDGHHELKVKFAGNPIPYPTGTLEYAVRTGSTWGAPAPLPWQSITPPALASYNGKLYALFVRTDTAVMWTRMEADGTWRTPERVGGDGSHFAPAVTAFNGKLWYAVTGGGGAVYWRTFTETGGWSAITRFPNYGAASGPTLATHNNMLWLVHQGTNNRLWLTRHAGGSAWAGPFLDNLGWNTTNSIALTSYSGYMWRMHTADHDNALYPARCFEKPTGPEWDGRDPINGWRTDQGPALATHAGNMWIFHRGLAGALYASVHGGTNWGTPQIVGAGAIKPMDEAAAVSHDNKLYVMYRKA
ncbi:hypothetical protein [Streptomyces virginiae]|uniref:hypothetical protein n=1 Tax=Streptomyces virginiae TaxID=1961 RepID=UPI0032432A2F